MRRIGEVHWLTLKDESAGKIKSLPYDPGMEPLPNSAPDSSTPSHFHPRLPVDEPVVVVAFAVLEVVLVLVINVVPAAFVVVVAAGPGRHWEYHGLEYVHTYPAMQVVAPVHPIPPH